MSGLEQAEILTLAAAPGAPFARDFFERLRACRRPEALLAIGSDRNALALCDALGNIFGAPCLNLANKDFPSLLVRKDGRLCVFEAYGDIAENAADIAVLAGCVPTNREDTGWSRYKSELI